MFIIKIVLAKYSKYLQDKELGRPYYIVVKSTGFQCIKSRTKSYSATYKWTISLSFSISIVKWLIKLTCSGCFFACPFYLPHNASPAALLIMESSSLDHPSAHPPTPPSAFFHENPSLLKINGFIERWRVAWRGEGYKAGLLGRQENNDLIQGGKRALYSWAREGRSRDSYRQALEKNRCKGH